MTVPSKTCVRRRLPSTTWKCTFTRSPGSNPGMPLRSCWPSRFPMTLLMATKGRAARRACARGRMVVNARSLSLAPPATLLQAPGANTGVVAREQDLGHVVAAPARRARVVRVLRTALQRGRERLLQGAVRVAERTRQLAYDGVAH